jgi:hypothetical protein
MPSAATSRAIAATGMDRARLQAAPVRPYAVATSPGWRTEAYFDAALGQGGGERRDVTGVGGRGIHRDGRGPTPLPVGDQEVVEVDQGHLGRSARGKRDAAGGGEQDVVAAHQGATDRGGRVGRRRRGGRQGRDGARDRGMREEGLGAAVVGEFDMRSPPPAACPIALVSGSAGPRHELVAPSSTATSSTRRSVRVRLVRNGDAFGGATRPMPAMRQPLRQGIDALTSRLTPSADRSSMVTGSVRAGGVDELQARGRPTSAVARHCRASAPATTG